MLIRKANDQDYKRVIKSLNRKPKIEFATTAHTRNDMKSGQLFLVTENDKPLAIFSLVFDIEYGMTYLKRLVILNKKNCGKGIAKSSIQYAMKHTQGKLALTPWTDNTPMRNMLSRLGFKHEKTFNGNYELYTH